MSGPVSLATLHTVLKCAFSYEEDVLEVGYESLSISNKSLTVLNSGPVWNQNVSSCLHSVTFYHFPSG